MCRTLPATRARTRCRLGRQRRFVRLFAWLTRLPTEGFFPQTPQILAIAIDSSERLDVRDERYHGATRRSTDAPGSVLAG
jgi:hypothetical protein